MIQTSQRCPEHSPALPETRPQVSEQSGRNDRTGRRDPCSTDTHFREVLEHNRDTLEGNAALPVFKNHDSNHLKPRHRAHALQSCVGSRR